MTSLEKSILSTIVYYDVLGMPLMGFEAWKYLIRNYESGIRNQEYNLYASTDIKLSGVLEILNKSVSLKKFIDSKNGFYFLKGRDNLYEQRIERKKIADQKWKKARKIVKWFQAIPYIKMVAVSGSLAQNNAKPESDFDLLIVVKKGRIWTARALVTLATAMLGVRRHGEKTKDRICLNHYITDESLEIKFRSLYNAQTYAHLVCLIADSTQIDDKLNTDTRIFIHRDFQRENSWIKDYLFFYPDIKNQNQRFIKPNLFLKFFAKFGEFLLNGRVGNQLEKFFRKIQLNHINRHPLRHKKGGRIVADDFQLEFHPDSPEKWILEEYNKKMIQLGFPELEQEKDSGLS